ncbi:hypothetical protein [Winogradskyella tangerina]|uniref:hypothetical protein n=1 Tax=Winogradskyella tangerina TaxID=2023240 RepID=UPI000DBE4B4B|nr:hypothetical protein [Winogradskyella tangerina]
MKKTFLIVFALFIGFNTYSQIRRDRNRIPQTNTQPSDADIAKKEREMEERKMEFINNFLTTLEADEFQKEITKQYISSFFDEKVKIIQTRYERSFDREEALKKLEDTHFKDLEELISESDMTKIKEMIKGNFDEKETKKKKKKRKKKKKKDKDNEEDNR